jgi:hypothetical protein
VSDLHLAQNAPVLSVLAFAPDLPDSDPAGDKKQANRASRAHRGSWNFSILKGMEILRSHEAPRIHSSRPRCLVKSATLDLVEELRLRQWARLNHVPAEQRCAEWHPVILNEMLMKDADIASHLTGAPIGQQIVPLPESRSLRLDDSHPVAGGMHIPNAVPAGGSEYYFA